jgi:ATP-dependent DNA helicase RecQ
MGPVTTTEQDLRSRAELTLAALAGPGAQLREDQWTAIHALVAQRRRALVVQRTGWGKSAVYFVATALLRGAGAGPTVIVSPLLALMRNQIEAAERAGIRAVTVNSANTAEWERTYAAVDAGEVDVLLVSPERLNNPDFRDRVLPRLTASAGMLVVDEAHCVSDWGHDFRPDYRRLRALISELPPGIPVLATTATANDRVVVDVTEQLGLTSGAPLVLRGSLDRESLRLSVVQLRTPAERLGWLAARLAELPGAGIVYTLTIQAAEDVAEFLRERGHRVASYTGKTEPEERLAAEADLLANRVKALVATSALGMGFDKPDLGFVVHLGAPASPVAYYQQIGRAGRAVDRAEVVLLPGHEDRDIWRYFASLAFPPEPLVRQTLDVLSEEPLSTAAIEPRVDLSRTRLEMLLKVLDADGAAKRVKGGWVGTGAAWVYDRERHRRIADARVAEQKAMLEYLDTAECRMVFLRRQLDDPSAAPCGRCDVCTDTVWSREVAAADADAARERLARPGVEVAPRRQWPSGMAGLSVPVSGRIPADEQAETGRVIGRLSDIGWGAQLLELIAGDNGGGDSASRDSAGGDSAENDSAMNASDGADQPVPKEVLDACVRVLAGWGWAERPVGVVGMGSRTRPHQLAHLARRIAEIGRLPLLGTLPPRGPRPAQHANSAQRLAAVWDAVGEPGFSVPPGPVLLVDDVIDTGWTITVAARLLRRAGASAVLPFALAAAG